MLNERPPGIKETICHLDDAPCEGQGADEVCNACEVAQRALGVPVSFIQQGKEYEPIGDLMSVHDKLLRGIAEVAKSIPPRSYTVDHRYANSQIRYRLLQLVTTRTTTLDVVARNSGLPIERLVKVCFGKVSITYRDMARVVKALFGDDVELFVITHWTDCSFSLSEKEACLEDEECAKMLEQCQREGMLP